MGLWMATALVVGNMIGSGIFLLPASLAAEADPVSMIGWAFTGAGDDVTAVLAAAAGAMLIGLAAATLTVWAQYWGARKERSRRL